MPPLPELAETLLDPKAYPDLNITHLTVDTRYAPPEDWYIIGVKKK